MINTDRRPANRPLPAHCPTTISVQIAPASFKGREQWEARHRFYGNGKPSDWMTIVVNFTKSDCPLEGQQWIVRPLHMAPVARVVFAQAVRKVERPDETMSEECVVEKSRFERWLESGSRIFPDTLDLRDLTL